MVTLLVKTYKDIKQDSCKSYLEGIKERHNTAIEDLDMIIETLEITING